MEERKGENGITKSGWADRKRRAAAAGIGFGAVCALPAMFSRQGDRLGYTNSIGAFLLWLALSWFFGRILKRGFEKGKRRWLIPGVFSFCFAACMVFGTALDKWGNVTFSSLSMWFCILALGMCFTLAVRYFWDCLLEKKGKVSGMIQRKTGKRDFALIAVVIFCCYVPVFLAVYPGFFVYDAYDELKQVISGEYSAHHPLVHVLLLGKIVQTVYEISGSYNLGIACYTLLQMAALCALFSFCICMLKKEGLSRAGGAFLALYFGLWPVIVMFSLCSAKDGLFTGVLLVAVLMLRELSREPESFWDKKSHVLMLAGSSLLMMLLRHNGFYAFLAFALLYTAGRKVINRQAQLKKPFFLFTGIIAGYIIINQGLVCFLHADCSENQEALTVPIQQMARVYNGSREFLGREDLESLYEVLPKEALERYTPKVSDGVKVAFRNETFSKNKGKYLKLWLKWGKEHPFTYLNAWFMTSYGFWYPDTVIDVYRGNTVFTYTYEDSSYFGFEVEEPGERQSKIPALEEWYRKLSLEIAQQRIPAVSMLFSPGFLFWATAFLLGFFLYAGESGRALPYLLPALVWMTVILGPTYLVRYVLFLWVLLPVLGWDFREFMGTDKKKDR